VNSKTEGEIWYFTLGSDALSGRTTFSFGRKKNIQPVGQREREREREREKLRKLQQWPEGETMMA
jgi:hypothetical protein